MKQYKVIVAPEDLLFKKDGVYIIVPKKHASNEKLIDLVTDLILAIEEK